MAAPKQARRAGSPSRPAGSGAKARDKGTRGGRPDPQAAATGARAGDGQAAATGRRPGDGHAGSDAQGRPGQPARVAAGAGRRPVPGKPAAPAAAAPEAVPPAGPPLWLRLATLVLSLGGLGVSVYLTVAHYTSSSILACSNKGLVNCAAVTTSPEATVFGVFPVAVLGLAFYVFMVAINSPWAWRAAWPAVRWARLGSVVVGIGFVLYLVYTELFTLNAICLWCTSAHVITFLLFGLIVFSAVATVGGNTTPRGARR